MAASSSARPMAASRSTTSDASGGSRRPRPADWGRGHRTQPHDRRRPGRRPSSHWFAELFGVAAPEPFGFLAGLDRQRRRPRLRHRRRRRHRGPALRLPRRRGRLRRHLRRDRRARASTTGPTRCSTTPARSTATTAAAASTSSATTATSSRSSPGPTAAAARARSSASPRGSRGRRVDRRPPTPGGPRSRSGLGVGCGNARPSPRARPRRDGGHGDGRHRPGGLVRRGPARSARRPARRRRRDRAAPGRPAAPAPRAGPATSPTCWPTFRQAAAPAIETAGPGYLAYVPGRRPVTARRWPSSWPGRSTATPGSPASPRPWWRWRTACCGWLAASSGCRPTAPA